METTCLSSKEKEKSSSLKSLSELFEKDLRGHIDSFGDKTKLRDACCYALLNGGKRIRPLIVLSIAKGLGFGLSVKEAALSVESFHTASLIVDDFPCMDNDDFRREVPSLHRMFGEPVALLASYALISSGYEKIFTAAQALGKEKSPFKERSHEACMIALSHAARCAGILGATGGQFFDLFSQPNNLKQVREVIYKKTITLFEVSFIFGWIFGGGDFNAIDKVKKGAFHFGMAFQIVDDFSDLKEDSGFNSVRVLGPKKAEALFNEELVSCTQILKELNLLTPEFQEMLAFFKRRSLS